MALLDRRAALGKRVVCALCQKHIDMTLRHPDPKSPAVDHIRQRSEGGSDDPDNLRWVHFSCNARRPRRPRVQGWSDSRLQGYTLSISATSFQYWVPDEHVQHENGDKASQALPVLLSPTAEQEARLLEESLAVYGGA